MQQKKRGGRFVLPAGSRVDPRVTSNLEIVGIVSSHSRNTTLLHAMSIPKLYYFDIPGKAEAARLACQYAGYPIEDVRLSREEFLAMKEAGRLPFGQVPVMDIGDGTMIGQSAAIMRYLGKKTGLYPSDDVVAALVDSIIDHEIDLFTGYAVSRYQARFGFGILSDPAILAPVRESLNTEVLPRHLAALENIIKKSSTGWAAGTSEPTIADFILVPRLEWLVEPGVHEGISANLLEPCPHIRAMIAKMKSLVAEMSADPEGFRAKRIKK